MDIKKFKEFKLLEKVSITISDNVTPFSLNNQPKTDEDKRKDDNFIVSAVKEFDRIFGSDYYQKFGTDFRLLVGKDNFFSKEVIESLSKEALNYKVNIRFNLLSEDNHLDTLYSNILRYKVSENSDEFLDFIHSILPKKVDKSKLYYKLFRKVGSEFNNDVIKDVLESKYGFDLKGEGKVMKEKYQRIFLRSLKNSMDRYQKKVKKGRSNYISVDEFFKNSLNYLSKVEIDDLKRDYIKKRLGDWVSNIKKM